MMFPVSRHPRSLTADSPGVLPLITLPLPPMKTRFVILLWSLLGLHFAAVAQGQNLPSSLGFSIEGSFINPSAESSNSLLVTDNDLTNGYTSGFDRTDAPAGLETTGPSGSAAFQWGEASTSYSTAYKHSSALWFQPLTVNNAIAEQTFELGYLFYRNGTIKSNTGADWVDLALTLSFAEPLGQDPISVVFGSELINTVNSSDAIASADIVSLGNLSAPIDFTDTHGNRYYLELTFKVDDDTMDGSLSTQDEFRVFEGSTGSATLLGRFTVDPVGETGIPVIPEPSSALLGALGMLFLIRRRR
jgi:hypothetical protein